MLLGPRVDTWSSERRGGVEEDRARSKVCLSPEVLVAVAVVPGDLM